MCTNWTCIYHPHDIFKTASRSCRLKVLNHTSVISELLHVSSLDSPFIAAFFIVMFHHKLNPPNRLHYHWQNTCSHTHAHASPLNTQQFHYFHIRIDGGLPCDINQFEKIFLNLNLQWSHQVLGWPRGKRLEQPHHWFCFSGKEGQGWGVILLSGLWWKELSLLALPTHPKKVPPSTLLLFHGLLLLSLPVPSIALWFTTSTHVPSGNWFPGNHALCPSFLWGP